MDCSTHGDYQVSLFPNPNNGSFSIRIQNNEKMDNVNLQLYDLTGRLLTEAIWSIPLGVSDFLFREDLDAGSYIFKIDSKNQKTQLIHFVVN